MNEVKKFSNAAVTPIHLTEPARTHILAYLNKHDKKGLRLSVKKSGCSGMAYVLDYPDEFNEEDIKMPLTDKYIISIDLISYPYIKNIIIDYVKEGLNHRFIFKNPNQTGQCGCGESFTIE